jgi:hypothetical protein
MDRDEGDVSFNDDEGDGLAALFGGITPSAEPPRQPGPRRSAAADPAVEPEPAPPPHEESAPPPAYQPPAAQPAAYQPPAYQPPAYQPPAYQPPVYQPPAPEPTAYQAPPDYAAPASTAYAPPAPAAPSAAPPEWPPASPAYDLPAPAPAPQAPASYDLPAPAPAPQAPASYDLPPPAYQPPPAEPPPSQEAPAYDLPAPGGASYPGAAPSVPAYPPTVQYPAGLDVASAPPAAPSYDLPASAPPPAPLDEPPPYGAPEQHVALPRSDGRYSPPSADPGYAPPPTSSDSAHDLRRSERPVDEHPLVRSEPAVPATVFPPGPLLPSSTAVETPDDLERSTAIEKVGLVLAVIAGPIGLLMAIINAARSARRRGWLIGIVRASLVLGVLSSLAAGIAAYVVVNTRLEQIAYAEVAAASAKFCAAAEVDPAMVTPPTLGWPAQGASVNESITTMQAWTDRWTALAASSPPKLRTGIELLAQRGQAIVDSVTQARVVDDATNQAQIAALAGQSGVAAWHATYCVAP